MILTSLIGALRLLASRPDSGTARLIVCSRRRSLSAAALIPITTDQCVAELCGHVRPGADERRPDHNSIGSNYIAQHSFGGCVGLHVGGSCHSEPFHQRQSVTLSETHIR
jgi:hypothetical protein